MDIEAKASQARRAEENELLVAVARGDVDALKKLYRIFERPLYSLGHRWLHDQGLAEELVQEVTVRIWRRAHNFDPSRGAAGAWIFGVARNVAADLARAQSRHPLPAERLPEGIEPWDEDSVWQSWQVARALRALPVEQQKVLQLAYVVQMTQSEIARTLDIPLGTVKTRIYQGLRRLRTVLIEMGIVEEQNDE